jgi:hypothetical protein
MWACICLEMLKNGQYEFKNDLLQHKGKAPFADVVAVVVVVVEYLQIK